MRTITAFLILSVFPYIISCTSIGEITQKDEIRTTLESENRFFLHSDNNEIYYFDWPYRYKVSNDTLVGRGRIIIDNSKGKTKRVKVDLENIQKLEVEEFDGAKTALGVGAVVAIGYVIYYLIDNSLKFKLGDSSSNNNQTN
jgi:hypothetical protein